VVYTTTLIDYSANSGRFLKNYAGAVSRPSAERRERASSALFTAFGRPFRPFPSTTRMSCFRFFEGTWADISSARHERPRDHPDAERLSPPRKVERRSRRSNKTLKPPRKEPLNRPGRKIRSTEFNRTELNITF